MIDRASANAEKLYENLGLSDKAIATAKAGNEVKAPDYGIGGLITTAVTKEGREEVASLNKALEETEEKLSDFWGNKTDFELRFFSNNDPALSAAKRKLESAESIKESMDVNLRVFREEHGLSRNVLNDDRLAQFLWALFAMLLEGLLNSYFFAPAYSTGLIGGFLVAFLISLVNVGIAFCGGVLGLRYFVNHNSAGLRLAGAFWFVLCVSICVFVVSMTAWFRGKLDSLRQADGFTEDGAQLADLAWAEALASLQRFELLEMFVSLNSFLLFFVGLICALVGFWKGYEYDDPFPGYGPLSRTCYEADLVLDDALSEYYEIENDFSTKQAKKFKEQTDLKRKLEIKSDYLGHRLRFTDEDNKATVLDDDLTQCANELLSMYLADMATLVAVSKSLPPPPSVDEFPGKRFIGFTQKNIDLDRYAKTSDDIEAVKTWVRKVQAENKPKE